MQIAATLVKGKARIKFDAPKVNSATKLYAHFKFCTPFRVLTVWPELNSPSNLLSTFMRKMVMLS